MSLVEQLQALRLTARKEHNAETLDSIQNVLAAIKNEEINHGITLQDAQVEALIARLVKQLKDALADFTTAGRTDLVTKTNTEIELLQSFLPQQLTDVEIDAVITGVLSEVDQETRANSGKVVGAVMAKVKGRADGATVRERVLARLSG
ncbi:MAG: GatB/YqeY domain-containing protein [Candidatus Magasanikbacteria bacterium]|nr:GatB/YqeY domain-containing protein [Candidatus Magasanikbacteria bacterium]